MKENLENSEWMKEAPYLAGLPVQHPFSVPEGYFDQLPQHIQNAIMLEDLKSRRPESGLSVPEGYFEALNDNIQSRISVERLKSIVKEDGHVTPDRYFEQLQAKINAKTQDFKATETKMFRLWHSKLLKYASAACFVILSAVAIYFMPNTAQQTNYTELANEQMLYDIDEHTIIEHIQSVGMEQTQPVVAPADLENYILTNYTQSDIASDL